MSPTATPGDQSSAHRPFARSESGELDTGEDPNPPQDERHVETAEYNISHKVSHGWDEDDTLMYRIRWTGYPPSDDTWKYGDALPYNLLVTYRRRQKLPPPAPPVVHAISCFPGNTPGTSYWTRKYPPANVYPSR